MALWMFPVMLGISAVATLVSGIWLALHLTAVTRLFAGHADIVAAPVRPRASRKVVRIWLAVFVIGVATSLAVPVLLIWGIAN